MLAQPHVVHYLPILTTVLAVPFFLTLINRYRFKRRGAHLLWWAGGVFLYGLGTALESTITLFGNSIVLNKAWFIAGALLGGYPLAQGTVYLLFRRKTANRLSLVTIPLIIAAAILVVASPVVGDQLHAFRPSGDLLEWQWIRKYLGKPINYYSALFLVGGAVISAARFGRHRVTRHRAIGNALIAIGALLPAIGGVMAMRGVVEGLYVGELIGLILIWLGYVSCVRRPMANSEDSLDLIATRPSPV